MEINKKIAELKGWIWAKGPFGNPMTGEIFEGGWKTDKGLRSYLPNWAEDISDAWELFEEMTEEENDWCIMHNPETRVYSCDSDFLSIETIGDTAQLAICKAWIKWKESKCKA